MRRLVLLLLLAVPAAAQTAPAPAPDPLQANKALVRRYIEEVLSANRMEKLDELLGPDFTDSTPGALGSETGPDIIRAAQGRIRALFMPKGGAAGADEEDGAKKRKKKPGSAESDDETAPTAAAEANKRDETPANDSSGTDTGEPLPIVPELQ